MPRNIAIDGFTRIHRNPTNVDRWIIRSSILEALLSRLPSLHGRLLDVGCGRMPYRNVIMEQSNVTEYVGLDITTALPYDVNTKPDATWDGRTMPFPDNSFDCVIATEVFEHATEISRLLSEIHRVAKPNGLMFFTTPFVWPYHEVPHDAQRWTTFGLARHLQTCGFTGISITSLGNWHSSLAQFLGLWVARSPMPSFLRRTLRTPVFLLQLLLMKYESHDPPEEGHMPRMLSGVAAKALSPPLINDHHQNVTA